MSLTNPVPSGRFTDGFGWRTWPNGSSDFHTGLDIAALRGTPILAVHSGVVTRAWWDAYANGAGVGGWMVEIRGDDGYTSRYAHMAAATPLSIGARVVQGQTAVGVVGSSGAATGDHLHLEILKNGQFVDPLPLITGGGGTPAPSPGRNTDMAFESIRRPDGTVIFADEYGVEGIDAYRTADIGASEYLDAFYAFFPPTKQLTTRQYDIVRAIADRRRVAIEGRQANNVLSKMGAQVEAAVKKALANATVGVDADIDVDELAKKVAEQVGADLAPEVAKAVNDDVSKRMSS